MKEIQSQIGRLKKSQFLSITQSSWIISARINVVENAFKGVVEVFNKTYKRFDEFKLLYKENVQLQLQSYWTFLVNSAILFLGAKPNK